MTPTRGFRLYFAHPQSRYVMVGRSAGTRSRTTPRKGMTAARPSAGCARYCVRRIAE